MKDTKVLEKLSYEVEIKGFKPSRVLKVHQDTGDTLAHSITKREIKNERLKKRVRQLEEALTQKMLFAKPLAMMVPRSSLGKWLDQPPRLQRPQNNLLVLRDM
jgi:hypothetical protein